MSAALRIVEVLTLSAVELDALNVREIGKAGREEGVRIAIDARAFAKIEAFVFLQL